MKLTSKQEIYEYVIENTKEFCKTHSSSVNTNIIGEKFSVSRSLASQYLNDLFKENLLIKISSRPVLFLDKKTIENTFDISIKENEFYSIDELIELLDERKLNKKDFMQAIGYNSSLSYCISQCQSAVKYPNNGVPILICGEKGVGKTFLSSLIYSYAKNESIISSSSKCLYLNYSAKEEIKDDEALFGVVYKKVGNEEIYRRGLIEQANNGFVVIENVEFMSKKCVYKILKYLNTGMFVPENSTDNKKSNTRLIFITSSNQYSEVDSSLLQLIPVICNVPSLKERPIYEKEALIKDYLLNEEKIIKREFAIYRHCYDCLLNYDFQNNISGLFRAIKTLCTNAYFEQSKCDGPIKLNAYNLPPDILNQNNNETNFIYYADNLINIDDLLITNNSDCIINFFSRIISLYKQFCDNAISSKEFLENCTESMNLYYDYIIFEKKYSNERVSSIEKNISEIANYISEIHNIYLPNNCSFTMARITYSISEFDSEIKKWNTLHNDEINNLLTYLKDYFKDETFIAEEIIKRIRSTLDLSVDKMNEAFLILNLQFYNKHVEFNNCSGVIVAHGFSTASSIADATNKLIGKHIFKAIDMPLNKEVQDIIPIIKDYIKNSLISKNLLLMVDMGSLENLGDMLDDIPGIKVGVLNNISTKIAIDIGFRIIRNESLEKMLPSVCEEATFSYQIIDNRDTKRNAVVFTSDGGIALTERAIQLVRNSMNSNLDFSLIPCDYMSLQTNGIKEDVFDKYNVLFVVSTAKLQIKDKKIVLLEDIVVSEASHTITKILSRYYKKEDVETFNKNLIKNFSLENVISHLTILDADKLFSAIEDAVEKMQILLNVIFTNNTIVGLYIHISNMIERIVTNSYFEGQYLDQKMDQKEKEFEKIFNNSFEELCKQYNIKIPQSEIIYIYRYVLDDIESYIVD